MDNLKEGLERIAAREEFRSPPEPWFSENESRKVKDLQVRGPESFRDDDKDNPEDTPDRAQEPDSERQLTLGSAVIHIQHVDTLVIQQGPQERDVGGQTVMCGF